MWRRRMMSGCFCAVPESDESWGVHVNPVLAPLLAALFEMLPWCGIKSFNPHSDLCPSVRVLIWWVHHIIEKRSSYTIQYCSTISKATTLGILYPSRGLVHHWGLIWREWQSWMYDVKECDLVNHFVKINIIYGLRVGLVLGLAGW